MKYMVKIVYPCEFDGYEIDVCLCSNLEEVQEATEVLEEVLSDRYVVRHYQMDDYTSTRKFKHKIKQIAKQLR